MDAFSIGEAFRGGWEIFKKRPWFLIGAGLVYMGTLALLSRALGELGTTGPILNIATAVANVIVQVIAGMGMTAFLLKAHDNVESVTVRDLWHPEPFWYYLGTSVLVCAIVVGGLILFIVPGIIFSIVYGFATYAVIDAGMPPQEALRASARMTRGHRWALLGFFLLSVLINLLGIAALIVGVLVTIPVTSLAFVHAYRLLQKQSVGMVAPAGMSATS